MLLSVVWLLMLPAEPEVLGAFSVDSLNLMADLAGTSSMSLISVMNYWGCSGR